MTLLAIAGVAALYFAPALLLVGLLGARLFPGERMIERARGAASGSVPASSLQTRTRPRPTRRITPRGSVLVAWRLAGRAPPALAAP